MEFKHPIVFCTHWGDRRPRNIDIELFWSYELTVPIFPQTSRMIVPEVYGDTRATTTPDRFAARTKNRPSASSVGSLRTYTMYATYKTKNVN